MEGFGNAGFPVTEDPIAEKHLPLGNYMSPDISVVLGDVLESWNFLCSFSETLGLKNPLSLEELMTGLSGFLSNGLSEAHVSILQILLGKLKVESKHSKISDTGSSTAADRTKFEVSLLNELTWLEVARRYALVFPSMNGHLKSGKTRVGIDVLRYLHADGGPLGGALTGIPKLKVDTWLLADAMNKIYGSLNYNDDTLIIDDIDYVNGSACQNVLVDEGGPDWVEELKPVKSLKTNVGSKIKKCIQNSLQKCPPGWAVEKLERSISKEVYKANASGPTKKAALGVIAHFYSMQQNVPSGIERRQFISMSDIVMKKCRVVFGKTAAAFYNLARGNPTIHGDKDEHSATPAMVSRLPIFRNIDLRLATGAYGGSHEAFLEDVQELYRDLPIAFDKLAGDFELSYKEEVVALQQRLSNYKMFAYSSANMKKEIRNVLISAEEIPEAPWEGLCKLCCIDEKDAEVLLCDYCNEEYHTFCLDPPLPKVPKGRWFCPCCNAAPAPATLLIVLQQNKKNLEAMNLTLHEFTDLAAKLHEKDYWELSVDERTILLKFFCGQFLNSAHIKKHLENLMQKNSFRSDFVGIDSSGRLYWIMDSGSGPWIIVNERNKLNQNDAKCPLTIEEVHGMSSAYSSLACYRSDVESEKIINFLEDDKLMKEKLESMLHTHKSRLRVSRNSKSQDLKEIQLSSMKPNYVLHNLDGLMTKAIKLLQSKYGPVVKLETPNLREDHSEKGKMVEKGVFYRCECLEPILPGKLHCHCCHKTLITKSEIQLHGDGRCNIPLTMPLKNGGISNALKREGTSVSVNKENETQSVDKFFKVPVCSPLTGNACEVLTHLKTNLLDMEAALSENAVRSSKSSVGKRLAWRAFVKSASTIFEMVQAMIVLEDMINTNYLDLSWRHSSSWSAAAKISTLSALSFRIYSLDAAISYDEISRSLKATELNSGSNKEKRQQNLKSAGKQRRKPIKKDEGTS